MKALKGGDFMAVTKVLSANSISLEVESGKDKSGAAIYRKKNFPNVNLSATPEDAYAVTDAIKAVLSAGTRDYLLVQTSKLVNA